MSLKIVLKPNEKCVINGAILQNLDRRISFVIHNDSSVLREKDILTLEEANTPALRIYFAIMMLYIDLGADENAPDVFYKDFLSLTVEFINAIIDEDILYKCISLIELVNKKSYYGALRICKKIIEYEKSVLEYKPNADDSSVDAL